MYEIALTSSVRGFFKSTRKVCVSSCCLVSIDLRKIRRFWLSFSHFRKLISIFDVMFFPQKFKIFKPRLYQFRF